jgi:hypothetical protein
MQHYKIVNLETKKEKFMGKIKTLLAVDPPNYLPGDFIASDSVMGRVSSAFYFREEWCYTLEGQTAVDTDQMPIDPDNPNYLRMGNRYIRDSDVKWWWHNIETPTDTLAGHMATFIRKRITSIPEKEITTEVEAFVRPENRFTVITCKYGLDYQKS